MLIPFESLLDGHAVRAVDRDKARIFAAIGSREGATRKRLASWLRIRPSTISVLVNELIDDALVIEARPLEPSRQGRPEILLQPRLDRFVVLVVHVVSHDIRATAIDMAGNVLAERVAGLDRTEAENADLIGGVLDVVQHLLDEIPAGSTALGVGVAVPGIIDSAGKRWIYSSRWPRMSNLSFDAIGERTGLPVRVSRNLTLELLARMLRRPEERKGGTLIVHWGYGIGSAYAWNGMVLESGVGSFGEFGHWTVAPDSSRLCHCGETGCLESEAALWAMLPEIRKTFPDAPSDEWEFERFLRDHDVADLPVVTKAVQVFALALANLHKAFYPEHLVLTGPFSLQEPIFERLNAAFLRHTPSYARDKCRLRAARPGALDVIHGSSMPFFEDALRERFLTHS